jgi:predicted HTH transcriptional regulator
LNKPIDAITEDDLNDLLEQKVTETKNLEYKEVLHFHTNEVKDEFRKDVTSFANSIGGDIVIGMREDPKETGVPGGSEKNAITVRHLLLDSSLPWVSGRSCCRRGINNPAEAPMAGQW